MAKKEKKTELIQTVKGMQDILPKEFLARKKILEKAKNVATYYGFQPIHTPLLERIELFSHGLGETTDVVEKQMYTLRTKGGDRLVLRPEGTAPIVRAYLEHGLHTKPQPVMLYYDGFFFRHENPQAGRKRELQQFGLEILGEPNSIADALVIKTALLVLEEMGLKSLRLHLNSIGDKECRKNYQRELVSYYRKKIKHICKDCQRRLKSNPLRLLDCKEGQCAEIKQGAPQMINYLCADCSDHFKKLLEILDASDVPYYMDHHLVRGFDYYSRTVFEIFLEEEPKSGKPKVEQPVVIPADGQEPGISPKENEDNQENAENNNEIINGETENNQPPLRKEEFKFLALAGGGRYDPLAKIISGKDIPGVGCAIGVDRVMEILTRTQNLPPIERASRVFLIQLGQAAKQKSLVILENLRKARIPASHSLSKDSLKSQLKIAAKIRASYALIYGQKESLDKTIIVRNMETGSQEIIPLTQLVDYLKKQLK